MIYYLSSEIFEKKICSSLKTNKLVLPPKAKIIDFWSLKKSGLTPSLRPDFQFRKKKFK